MNTPRLSVVLALASLLVGPACNEPAAPRRPGEGLRAEPLPSVLPRLDPITQRRFTDFASTIPPSIPSMATAMFVAIDPPSPPPGRRPGVFVGNAGSTDFDVGMVCVVDFAQVPCLEGGAQVTLGERQGLRRDLVHDLPAGGHIDVVFVVAGDLLRPYPASKVLRHGHAPSVPSMSAPHAEKRLGGCDVVGILSPDNPPETYQRPGSKPRTSPLTLDVEFCEEGPHEFNVYAIANRSRLLALWQHPWRIQGRTFAVDVPADVRDGVGELQFAVIEGERGALRTVSHSVELSG